MNSPLFEVVVLRTIGTMAPGPGCLPREHPIPGFFLSARWLRVSLGDAGLPLTLSLSIPPTPTHNLFSRDHPLDIFFFFFRFFFLSQALSLLAHTHFLS